MKKSGQNLIEFVVVAPIFIILIFGIIEIALFWRSAHSVQEIALEAASVAASKIVSPNSTDNPAVTGALNIMKKRAPSLGITSLNLVDTNLGSEFGTRPYALYEFKSSQTRNTINGIEPLITLTVDYRDPYKNGVITQLSYQYQTVLLGAEFQLAGGKTITIIPRDIPISSTKIQQYITY